MTFLVKKRLRHPPLRSNVPRIYFKPYFLWFVSFHFRWNFVQIYTTLYIEQLVISQINHFLFSFWVLLTQSKLFFFLPVAPTFPNFPVFISSLAWRFFEVFELTFVPVGFCANSLRLTTRCNLFYIIQYPITNLVPVQSLTVFCLNFFLLATSYKSVKEKK